mmetsp:Transcript_7310/g.17664  ORF Transcript_7310/g.17664 Transcript_7310/m.17664 type:complete len:821 (+) Transcript_7310:19-2481(+)
MYKHRTLPTLGAQDRLLPCGLLQRPSRCRLTRATEQQSTNAKKISLFSRPSSSFDGQSVLRRKFARSGICAATSVPGQQTSADKEGASTDLSIISKRLAKLALPFWTDPEVGGEARKKLAVVLGLTLGTTGVSVLFNFLGRDFFNALSEKNAELFTLQLFKYLAGFALGIPVFVYRSYCQSRLAVEWRAWMTEKLMSDYFDDRTFYTLQSEGAVDNPDQRISSDVVAFTDTALTLSIALLTSALDLISFSGILFSIYPPLFVALLLYSTTGTVVSLYVGKSLVGLNFAQEAREADFRYGLVRVRENAESVAFYRGETDEKALLSLRLQAAVENYFGLLIATRNLDFFTSFYRFLIQLLPAAVVAPLFFQGKIEFGVINQSVSAFNHILTDVSLVVYQFESLAGFSAIIDRLGQFQEAMSLKQSPEGSSLPAQLPASAASPSSEQDAQANGAGSARSSSAASETSEAVGASSDGAGSLGLLGPGISVRYLGYSSEADMNGNDPSSSHHGALLELQDLSVVTPDGANLLIDGLSLQVQQGSPLLIMGPSGAGKTSILRAIAGLWNRGRGEVVMRVPQEQVMFLPQKPYMALGSLRSQVLYPNFPVAAGGIPIPSTASFSTSSSSTSVNGTPASNQNGTVNDDGGSSSSSSSMNNGDGPDSGRMPSLGRSIPSDSEIMSVLRQVRLGYLLTRHGDLQPDGSTSTALDTVLDWSLTLSLGEQQRLAWARLLLAKPRLALLDEASSALDQELEADLYQALNASGITFVSIGHRPVLRQYHKAVLQLMRPQGSHAEASGAKNQTPAFSSSSTMAWELQDATADAAQ